MSSILSFYEISFFLLRGPKDLYINDLRKFLEQKQNNVFKSNYKFITTFKILKMKLLTGFLNFLLKVVKQNSKNLFVLTDVLNV